ncbi:efflux RND transporter periplasmic adaptor subunit [Pedobacter sp. B4-66]|uniref:efflux RND transporter periplasmic adaptor subunit n=1 Tax=Pedobacter sp. B4-66 TaxID=2817280 RepID=UPI001BD9F3D7|nr:efflux RND transporter periplasmic adaptor subunit [Pedobacter sp. B4-66]
MIQQIIQCRRTLNRLLFLAAAMILSACGGGQSQTVSLALTEVDFLTVSTATAGIQKKFPGNVEGSVSVDVKVQVSGYLDAIYVKEGDYVTKGQRLFQIKSEVFNEQVNNAQAMLKSAIANQATAKIEVEKIRPLVEGKVVSAVQLQSAQAAYDAASAAVSQAKASVSSARLNADFALIKAPVSGYIGRIPKRVGNLVTPSDAQPLTTLADINTLFVYFSMSEAEYIGFRKDVARDPGIVNNVELIIADGSTYGQLGKLETASGNIDPSTGSITLKAVFSNPDKLLRSGGSARVVINQKIESALSVPMASVKDIQDRFFVFMLDDSNKVSMSPLQIAGRSGENYLVKSGIKAGDKVALNNIDVLVDGMQVKPKLVKSK